MRFKLKASQAAFALAAGTVATVAIAATFITLATPVVVSTDDTANNAFKAKMGWISYMNGPAAGKTVYDIKAQLLVYADGPAGKQNIWVARSTDNGTSWAQTKVTTNGGTPLTIGAESFFITHNKPNIYVAPIGVLDVANTGKGADALLTWTSTDCESLGTQKINANLNTGPQPYMCLWSARSKDGGQTWATQRLTDGSMDPDEDVPAGFVSYKADTSKPLGYSEAGGFAISYQADPAGLQQGDAEGPGDGASGAKVSAGTNIWYTFLSKAAFEAGTAFPAAVQISDNDSTDTGAAGASRANLGISGGTTVLAYEETKGDGTSGKRIVYHSFAYGSPSTHSAGTAVSDPTKNARRVRFMLQGNEALDTTGDKDGDAADGDTKGVHAALIWRETASLEPAAPSDIMMRRGIKNTSLRPGSTGFLADDILADTPVNLTDTGPADNALAHRGTLRGDFVSIAYDHTVDAVAANPEKTNPPKGTYNLFIKRSTDGGETWSAARNMSNVTDLSVRVVEPRQVGTPGTIKLPNGAATSDTTDIQNRDVIYVGWGTETNEINTKPLDINITRTKDLGLSYDRVQLLADGATEQSEAQLRTQPDGTTLGALWMQRDATAGTVDVVYRNGDGGIGGETTFADPDLSLTATGVSFAVNAQGQVTYTILNKGTGDARAVVLTGTAPTGLTIVSTSESTLCAVNGASFTCTIPELLAGASRAISVTVTSAATGSYAIPSSVTGDVVETDNTNNDATANVTVSAAATGGGDGGGGCTTASGDAPRDPMLPILAAVGLLGMALRRRLRRD